jgi:hypothetical protein
MDSGAPQSPQKRLPAEFSLPQLEQRMAHQYLKECCSLYLSPPVMKTLTLSKEGWLQPKSAHSGALLIVEACCLFL